MKKKCNLYAIEDISRFIDGEFTSDQHQAMEYHLSLCEDCRHLVDSYRSLSVTFSRIAVRESNKNANALNLEHKFEKIISDLEEKSSGNISGLFGKNIYLKLASIAAVLMIGLFPYDENILNNSSGPSAIVNSVDAEYTSVMIIETQEEKHTIIWFTEET